MKKTESHIIIIFYLLLFAQFANSQPRRETWQPPEEILDSLGVKPGMLIGEIGAGEGYMTFPLLEKVGLQGKVYANDISSWSHRVLKNKKEREKLENLVVVEGNITDPMFPAKNLDMLVMVYVFHDLAKPVEFTSNTLKYLNDKGTLVLIEKDIVKDPSGAGHFLPQHELINLMKQTGYKLLRISTFLENDNIYIFGKE